MTGDKPIGRTCRSCQVQFTITPAEQEFLRALALEKGGPWVPPLRCVECRRARRRAMLRVKSAGATDIELTCVDCRSPFLFRVGDQAFYLQQGFPAPRRCPPCRKVDWVSQALVQRIRSASEFLTYSSRKSLKLPSLSMGSPGATFS
jgi:hypothetical protein